MHHADAERNCVVGCANLDRLPVDQNLAAIGRVKAVSDAHGGGFAGAVFPDNGVNSSGRNFDRHAIVGKYRAESLRDVAEFDHCVILSTTLISPPTIFFFASSAA